MSVPPLAALLALSPTPAAQEALAPFDAAQVQLDRYQAPFRRMVDFDLDGDLDAIGAVVSDQRNSYRLMGYENDGAGKFTQVWYDAVRAPGGYYGNFGQGELLIQVGRRDADPFPDVEVFIGLYRFTWYGNGDGSFDNPVWWGHEYTGTFPRRATGLALADLDQDGLDDLVWSDTEQLNVLTTTGQAGSLPHGSVVSATTHLWLDVLLRDGPGALDVFLVTKPTAVQLFYGSPAGLQAGPTFAHDVMMVMADTGDVDGDGDVDAVLFGMHDYRVLRRTTPGTWTLEATAVGGPATFLADVDGDGDLDGACCGGGGNPITYAANVQPTDFEISLNDGTGAFAPAFEIPGLGSPELAGVVDVDQDGDADLVAGRCVYFARGPIEPPEQWAGLPAELVRNPRTLCDFDGDGDVDAGLALGSVHANDGAGHFGELAPAIAPGPSGTTLRGPGYPGDFDGDGDDDLLLEVRSLRRQQGNLGHGASTAVHRMWLAAGDGSGSFPTGGWASEPGVTFALDSLAAEGSLVADVDADGDLDLFTRTIGGSSDSALWANDGTGFLSAALDLPGHLVAWTGDVNLDGVVDLLATHEVWYGSELGLLLGAQGAPGEVPAFAPDPQFATGWALDPIEGGIAEGDYYLQDGFPDIAISKTSGTIQFPREFQFFANYVPHGRTLQAVSFRDVPDHAVLRTRLGDVDLDGVSDALAGPVQNEDELTELSQYMRRSGTTFSTALQLMPTGELVDLDLDGDLDVLAERVVLNRTIP